MATTLVLMLIAISGMLLLWGGRRPAGLYQFPFLAGLVFSLWVIPQLVGLLSDDFLPPGALEKTTLMTILCATMCVLGYRSDGASSGRSGITYDDDRLIYVAVFLTFSGAFLRIQLRSLPDDLLMNTQMTGLPVALLFVSDIILYGVGLAYLLYFKSRSKLAFYAAICGTVICLDKVVFHGRRGDAIKLILIVVLSWWFQRRRTVPRPVAVAGCIMAFLVFLSIGQYRAIVLDSEGVTWSRVLDIDLVGTLTALSDEGGYEMRNAVYNIEAIDRSFNLDFGLFHWNTLVFNYVPAQLVGPDTKQSLMIDLGDAAYAEFGYSGNVGATLTGITDAFGSFWYLGFLKFLVIAYVLGRLYNAAMRQDLTSQLLYMIMLPNGIHAITHHTHWFVSPWLHMAIFLAPLLLWARRSSSSSRRPVRPKSTSRHDGIVPEVAQ